MNENDIESKDPQILLAGATGNLGVRIARNLVQSQFKVRAVVRPQSATEKISLLQAMGIEVVTADFGEAPALARACAGIQCVVSALSGVREVIVEAQTQLLDAAVKARVPRFIPSDYALDFMKLRRGQNRNLDWRREFAERLGETPIRATSILNGAFTDMLTGQAPIILFKLRRVLYWQDADQLLDFTTMDDTAKYVAKAAGDKESPRVLRIAGDQISARQLCEILSDLTGSRYKLWRAGSLDRLQGLIKIAKFVVPGGDEVYPPWQGMQYLHNMFSGRAKLAPLDNNRYGAITWTKARDVLKAHLTKAQ